MPRAEKVAVVEEIRDKLTSSGATVLTEYRGLSVPALAELRASLREADTTYKVYKNTLARRAVDAAELEELADLLIGPTAFAFVDGDVVGAAKALRDYSRTNENLVIKGGLLRGRFISAEQVDELAKLPTRDELLAKTAGVFKAPMRKAAGLFSALQRNTAYALKALIDKRVEAGEAPPPDETEAGEAPPPDETEAGDVEQPSAESGAAESTSEAGTSEDSEDDSGAAESAEDE